MKVLKTGVETLVDLSGWANPKPSRESTRSGGKINESNELRKPTKSSSLLLPLGAWGRRGAAARPGSQGPSRRPVPGGAAAAQLASELRPLGTRDRRRILQTAHRFVTRLAFQPRLRYPLG